MAGASARRREDYGGVAGCWSRGFARGGSWLQRVSLGGQHFSESGAEREEEGDGIPGLAGSGHKDMVQGCPVQVAMLFCHNCPYSPMYASAPFIPRMSPGVSRFGVTFSVRLRPIVPITHDAYYADGSPVLPGNRTPVWLVRLTAYSRRYCWGWLPASCRLARFPGLCT
jgi:hypothetical protein